MHFLLKTANFCQFFFFYFFYFHHKGFLYGQKITRRRKKSFFLCFKIGPNGTGKWVAAVMSSHLVFFLYKMGNYTVLDKSSMIWKNAHRQGKLKKIGHISKTQKFQWAYLFISSSQNLLRMEFRGNIFFNTSVCADSSQNH